MIARIGLIGLGSIGDKHLKIIKKVRPNIQVVVLSTKNKNKLKKNFLINKTVSNINDLIKSKVQATIIATPASMHFKQALKLMKAGMHVLIEKPIAIKSKGLSSLTSLEKNKKLTAAVGYVFRHDTSAIEFHKLLKKNFLGKILSVQIRCSSYLPSWRKKINYRKSVSALKSLGGGVLMELSHEIDYARWLFGEIYSVYAEFSKIKSLGINVEECVDMILKTKLGLNINIHLDFNSKKNERKCIVNGTSGKIIWDLNKKNIQCSFAKKKDIYKQFSKEKNLMYKNQLKNFLYSVEKNKKAKVSLNDGIKVQMNIYI